MNKGAIGIFDSGIGGLSIYREIKNLIKNESTIYIADNLNAPYGKKNENQIIDLSIENTKKLIEKGSKIIVVACNTATTNAVSILREEFKVPIVGVEPSVKPALLNTKTKNIGILATEKTLSSKLFQKTSDKFSNGITIHEKIGFDLVEIIEKNGIKESLLNPKLKQYTSEMINNNIDHLVLGCTHYYYLIPLLKKILPKNVTILDSSKAVAKRTEYLLKYHNIQSDVKKHSNKFYYTGNSNVITSFLINKENITRL